MKYKFIEHVVRCGRRIVDGVAQLCEPSAVCIDYFDEKGCTCKIDVTVYGKPAKTNRYLQPKIKK